MSDNSYPFRCHECSVDSEWNYIFAFFDVISYQAPTGSAKNQRPAKTRGYTMRDKILKYCTPDTQYKYLNEKLKKGEKIGVIGT